MAGRNKVMLVLDANVKAPTIAWWSEVTLVHDTNA